MGCVVQRRSINDTSGAEPVSEATLQTTTAEVPFSQCCVASAIARGTGSRIMTASPPKLLNVGAAAAALGVSESWLNKSRLTGQGPSFIRVGTRCLYDPDDLTAWISDQRRTSTSHVFSRSGR